MIRLCVSRWLILTLVLAALAGPARADGPSETGTVDAPLSRADQDPTLAKFHNVGTLRKFYSSRNGSLAWWRNGAWSDQARQAVAVLNSAGNQGLNPGDYLVEETSDLPDRVDAANSGTAAPRTAKRPWP